MNILFLGTGAADWAEDTPNIDGVRRMSSAVIDDLLLIDAAPSSFRYFKHLGKDEARIEHMLLTHSHEDHLSIPDLLNFAKGSALKLWCHGGVIEKLQGEQLDGVTLCELKPFVYADIGGMRVTPLPANHIVENSSELALHFVIESEGKKLFYGCDGGWFRCETWDYLREQVLDCVVLDCTCGEMEQDYNWRLGSHNDIKMLRYLVKNMRVDGILADGALTVASHLARTLHKSIEETEHLLAKDDIIAAADGMELYI